MTFAYYPPPPPYRRPRRFRPLRWLLGLLALGLVLLLGMFGLMAWAWSSAGVDTVGRSISTSPLRDPAAGALARRRRRPARLRPDRAGRARHDFGGGPDATRGGSTAPTSGPTLRADARRAGRGQRPQRAGRDHQRALARHAPAGRGWTAGRTSRSRRATPGPRPGRSTSRRPRSGTTRTRTATPASTSTAASPGMFILDDPAAGAPTLPHEYGVDDVPVIVQDKAFGDDGELDDERQLLGGIGLLGDTLAGQRHLGPYLDVTTERVRLRLLNASNARVYDFGFADDRAFALVGTDGGLLPRRTPPTGSRSRPASGRRSSWPMRPGERVVLRSVPARRSATACSRRFAGGRDSFDVLELRAADRLAPRRRRCRHAGHRAPASTRAPALRSRPARSSSPAARSTAADGHGAASTRPSSSDSTEVWEVRNRDGDAAQLPRARRAVPGALRRRRRAAAASCAGWKDTIYLRPSTTTDRDAVRRLRRPGHAVHVPLPPAAHEDAG